MIRAVITEFTKHGTTSDDQEHLFETRKHLDEHLQSVNRDSESFFGLLFTEEL